MNKGKLLPRLAVRGIRSNGCVYFPYIGAGIFAVFTYFVFSSILHNDLIKTLPRSVYAWMLLEVGRVLLGIILFLFLAYTGSFLIRRRKQEIGLYTILGLEKRHIAAMLFLEMAILCALAAAGGIIFGTVLSKLLFLLLLRLTDLPVDVKFVFTWAAFRETLVYFAGYFLFQYAAWLWALGRVRPAELFSGSRRGEKEPGHLPVWAALGILTLGAGYAVAVRTRIDGKIFLHFFLSVFLVIVGTGLLFTSGIAVFLRLLRKNSGIYYRSVNFITISGMFYRMKKNAASLVNICIFSTMVMITLVCTVSLHLGMDGVTHFSYPYDLAADFQAGSASADAAERRLAQLEEQYGLPAERADVFDLIELNCSREGNRFGMADAAEPNGEDCPVRFLLLEDYVRLTGDREDLADGEILLYAEGADFGYDTVDFMGIGGRVKKEFTKLLPYPKAGKNAFHTGYIVVVRDMAQRNAYVRAWAEQNGVEDMDAFLSSGRRRIGILLSGEDTEKQAFVDEFAAWCRTQPDLIDLKDGVTRRAELCCAYGGLLFIGVVFAVVFFLCLIIIMYYKQISEGWEDKGSFAIMQKVGMDNREIRSTVRRQILMLFGLPLTAAFLHMSAGLAMVDKLMAAINFYNTRLLLCCTAGVCLVFMLVYCISYMTTARTYYRIVKGNFYEDSRR